MEKNGNLNTFLFMNQNEYNPSSSSSDEESYESNEEQEDNDGNFDDVYMNWSTNIYLKQNWINE